MSCLDAAAHQRQSELHLRLFLDNMDAAMLRHYTQAIYNMDFRHHME